MEICCSSSLVTTATPLLSSKASVLSSSNSVFFRNELRKKTGMVLCGRRAPPMLSASRRSGGCRCLFGLGVPEIAVIAGVAALLFGPKKLPDIGRSIGKTVKSFQEAAKEFETELKKEQEEGVERPVATTTSDNDENKLETSATKENV